jgi:hypothetical protein
MRLVNSKPESQEAFVRIGCGALVGLLVGAAIVVGTAGYWGNSMVAFAGVVVVSVVVCAVLGRRFGDRFFSYMHKWIGWFR